MGKRSREKGLKRREEAAATRAAIATQYGLPKSAMETSKPRELGRTMFLSKREADAYFSAMKQVDPKLDRNDPATWNPKKEKGE